MSARDTRPGTGPIGPSASAGPSLAGTRPAAVRRVIGVAPPPAREPSPLDGGIPWATGLLAAAQAAVLSLAVVVVPAIAVFVVTSAEPANVGVAWTRSVEVGAAFWLLAHGVPFGDVTLVPLGLTALVGYACYASARRSARPAPSAALVAVGSYVVIVVLVASLVPGASPVRAAVGGLLVGTLGLGTGLLRRPDADPLRRWLRRPWSALPGWLRAGVAGGVAAAGVLAVLAALTAAGWVLAGRESVVAVVRGLGLDAVGGAVLAVAEVGFAPNLAAWAAAWIAGPGFAVGAGSHVAVDEVVLGPLPAIPLLGALPTPDLAGGASRWAPVLLVVAGLVAGLVVHRRLAAARWWEPVAASAAAAASAGLLVAAGVAAAGGAVGTDRMAAIGAPVAAVGALAAAGALVGALLVAPLADPLVRSRARAALGGAVRSDRTAAAPGPRPPARTG